VPSCPIRSGNDKVADMAQEKQQGEEPAAGLRRRASGRLRVMRAHWAMFAAVAGLCILGTGLAVWACMSREVAALRSRNAVLAERIEALASTAPAQWRRLSDRARGLLLAGLEHPDNDFKLLVVYAAPDSESRQYAAQFVDAARLVGIETRAREMAPAVAPETGLAVGAAGAAPSEQAEKLKDILASAGLDIRSVSWAKPPGDDAPVEFALFVGPKPW
jgi:hypothetical protein